MQTPQAIGAIGDSDEVGGQPMERVTPGKCGSSRGHSLFANSAGPLSLTVKINQRARAV
jgi:hypothetical protein